MPPLAKKKYTQEDVERARKLIDEGSSIRQASISTGVPTSTLQDKVNGKYRPGKKAGRDPYLSETEEEALVK